jgi:hypothetical protein
MPLRGTGEVMGLRPGLLQVRTDQGGVWLMKIEATPDKIVVQGTAEPTWLRRGMWVRFSTTLDTKGVAQSPLEELFVFTRTPETLIGIFPDSGPTIGAPEPAPKKSRSRRKRGAKLLDGPYLVAGQIAAARGGEVRVVAAGQAVRAKLAEKTTIRVDFLGDYSLVRAGDKVEFVGSFYQQGQALVSELKFQAATPFGSELAKPTAPKRRRPPPAPRSKQSPPVRKQPSGPESEPAEDGQPQS